MQTTFYRQKITKQQFDSIQSNWKNISEIEEEIDILDIPKSKMQMVLRVPITLNGKKIHMTVNCRIIALEDDSSIHLKVIGNNFKPIFISILIASPIALIVGVLFLKPFLIIPFLPLFGSLNYYIYFKRIKTTSQAFVNELLKGKKP
jgi:hypothetical protein